MKIIITAIIAMIFLSSCENSTSDNDDTTATLDTIPFSTIQIDRLPWYESHPMSVAADFTVVSEDMRLAHTGKEDSLFILTFPEDNSKYGRAILTYRMGAWGERPGEWDMNTIVSIKDKKTGLRYEIARAVTAYGNAFGPDWSKTYYLDVTEFLPMLKGDTEFYLYYGGYDATPTRAHSLRLTVQLYEDDDTDNVPIFTHNLYSSKDPTKSGPAWLYGSRQEEQSIEAPERLGMRSINIPDSVDRMMMRVSMTGHGHDQGTFPDRNGYRTRNAAEFDENFYDIIINEELKGKGHIFYKNGDTYPQAGTYMYDRAGWGPGLPVNVQYWSIKNIPNNRNMTIDLNLDRFISENENGSKAQFIIRVDLFGYKAK